MHSGLKWLIPVAALALVAAYLGFQWWHVQRRLQRGGALYRGELPLAGKLVGHSEELPLIATRCVNCHQAKTVSPDLAGARVEKGSNGTTAFAPTLTRAWLSTARSRHGGPASAYDADTFCKLLRTGVDPVYVMIPSTMPRYAASDLQCEDLWAYLESRQ